MLVRVSLVDCPGPVLTSHIGEMLAIMGPSGSGKTTLLNALAHRRAATGSKVEGDICIDGIRPSLRAFRHVSSYVEQEDALIGALTVQETLNFAARLSLPRLAPSSKPLS
jgi:ABC-type multidrug transport system ATPase subunit